MGKIEFRKASVNDVPFLVNTIIEAEKSGTDVLTYTTLFGLSEDETRKYLSAMLGEEIDGCELSISSFLLAVDDNKILGAVAAWIEGEEGMPSSLLKGNLLNYCLPKEALLRALDFNEMLREIHIEYINNSIQIGVVFIEPEARGLNLAQLLIDQQIKDLQQRNPSSTDAFVQVFGNNRTAIRAYEKANFRFEMVKESSNERICEYLPYKSKVLMKRELNNKVENGKRSNF